MEQYNKWIAYIPIIGLIHILSVIHDINPEEYNEFDKLKKPAIAQFIFLIIFVIIINVKL